MHVEIIGYIEPKTVQGHENVVVITDDDSRLRWAFCIAIKRDAHQQVIDFIKSAYLRCQPFQLTAIRIDQCTEFRIKSLPSFCSSYGIDLEYSAAYTPEQNGIAKEVTRSSLLRQGR